MSTLVRQTIVAALMVLALHVAPNTIRAQQLQVRDICRVKGQEENTLHGLGLVVGLDGTGDTETPTMRALAKMLELMGNPVGQESSGQWNLEELANAKNVAMVFVSATVPREGARQGDTLNCDVNAISASSLKSGFLMMTPLVGPRRDHPELYAFCQGPISIEQRAPETTGKVHKGCRLEQNLSNEFVMDGKMTLVLDRAHTSFQNAQDLESVVDEYVANFKNREKGEPSDYPVSKVSTESGESEEQRDVRAIDSVNIEVVIPEEYVNDPVSFAAEVMSLRIVPPQHGALVYINKRNGTIVIGENVLVGRVAISHSNIAVQTGGAAAGGPLQILETSDTTTIPLNVLVEALNSLKVGTDDIISIIESLEENHALYGRIIR